MYKKILFLALFSFAIGQHHNHDHSLTDDGYIRCATDELEQELQLLNPEFIAERDAQILKEIILNGELVTIHKIQFLFQ